MTAVAFLGLGTMGYPMAGHLQREGYDVCVYNRSSAKALRWVEEYAGRRADTPREACAGAELVFCCVGNDDDLRAVALGEQGAFAGMAPGSLFVDHTTASAEVARELSLLAAERELGFLDAPVSGGQAGAVNGALTVMVGGEEAFYRRAEPLLRSYARMVRRMGDVGSGQLTKMVNQICVAGLLQGLAALVQALCGCSQRSGLGCAVAAEHHELLQRVQSPQRADPQQAGNQHERQQQQLLEGEAMQQAFGGWLCRGRCAGGGHCSQKGAGRAGCRYPRVSRPVRRFRASAPRPAGCRPWLR